MEETTECVRPKNKVIDGAVAYTLCVSISVCVWCMYLQRLVRNAATAYCNCEVAEYTAKCIYRSCCTTHSVIKCRYLLITQ